MIFFNDLYLYDLLLAADMNDPLFSSEYAPDIFSYMRKREVLLHIVSVVICTEDDGNK